MRVSMGARALCVHLLTSQTPAAPCQPSLVQVQGGVPFPPARRRPGPAPPRRCALRPDAPRGRSILGIQCGGDSAVARLCRPQPGHLDCLTEARARKEKGEERDTNHEREAGGGGGLWRNERCPGQACRTVARRLTDTHPRQASVVQKSRPTSAAPNAEPRSPSSTACSCSANSRAGVTCPVPPPACAAPYKSMTRYWPRPYASRTWREWVGWGAGRGCEWAEWCEEPIEREGEMGRSGGIWGRGCEWVEWCEEPIEREGVMGSPGRISGRGCEWAEWCEEHIERDGGRGALRQDIGAMV
eukprot:scaffold26773_cov125-Isochrysis_galbana.AAC.3